MPRTSYKLSPKTIGFVAALVVPMLLIPSMANAKSSRADWSFLNQPIKVRQGDSDSTYNQKSDRTALRNFFDAPAPRNNKATNRARNKRANRARQGSGSRGNRSRRHGYNDGYYQDEFAASCVAPRKIHQRLHRQGWRNFHNLRIRANVLTFKAQQRRQGQRARDLIYNMSIDRCSGAIIKAKLRYQDRWYLRWMRRISSLYQTTRY